MLRINPTKMTANDCYLLDFLVSGRYEQTQLNPDTPYNFLYAEKETGATKSAIAILTHEIIKRPCNPHGKHRGEWRYEIIDENPLIGSGNYSSVLKTVGTFIPGSEKKPAQYKIKERVVKCFKPEDSDEEDFVPFDQHDIQREYELTPPHMGMKPPIKLEDDWCLVMRQIEGDSLTKILRSKTHLLPIDDRISLCISIAEALMYQVHNHHVVHRDIKPDNILVCYNEKEKKWISTIIDFGLAKKPEENDKNICPGTPVFSAPEARKSLGTTFKSDIYSIACIFSEILGCNRSALIRAWKDLNKELNLCHINLSGLFQNIPDVDPELQTHLICLLKDMSRSSPDMHELETQREKRPSADIISQKLRSFQFFKTDQSENNATNPGKPLSTSSDKHRNPLTNLTI